MRIRMSEEEAEKHLENLPMDRKFWVDLADRFLSEFASGEDNNSA